MYAYAFINGNPPLGIELPPGIVGSLDWVCGRQISAVVEPGLSPEFIANDDDDAQLIQAVVTHDRVICQLFHQTPVLPLRFGNFWRSPADLLNHLIAHEAEYIQKLTELAPFAEYTLKCTPLEEPNYEISPDARGKNYLLAKKQRYQMQQQFQTAQAAEWENIKQLVAQDYPHIIPGEPQNNQQRLYFLADRSETTLLQERHHYWQQASPRWQVHLGEPLPPYHFV
ncbi:MAG TPA: GvpL/GvpF family gas vesicle protein [Oscillatoriaceae cyanobacterium M33_DOE_052]|nr:GvpL/GvpF family gas vesicle protein [Oscillatoriaceae cyanobacterium M33_DOE_052]